MGLAARTLGWLAVRHKRNLPYSAASTDVTVRPSAGGDLAWQMAKNRIGDGLSIKWHFLGGGELVAPRSKEECKGSPLLA